MKKILVLISFTLLSVLSFAATKSEKTKVRYKKGGRIDFESLLIEGERKKPEMSVVTGNLGEKDTGLLKFRKDFNDMMAKDFGEKVR
jgi:hypothetical protein